VYAPPPTGSTPRLQSRAPFGARPPMNAYGLRLTAYGLRLTAYGLRLTAYGLRGFAIRQTGIAPVSANRARPNA